MKRKSERKKEEIILYKRLNELLEEKRDTDHTQSNCKIAAAIGIKYNTFLKYITESKDTSECSISNLAKIAQYFGVSCDWLLGLSETRSPQKSIRDAQKTTGLSGDALAVLQYWNQDNTQKMHLETLSEMLKCGGMPMFLEYVHNASCAEHEILKISKECAYSGQIEESTVRYIEAEESKDFNSYRAQKQLDHIIENI